MESFVATSIEITPFLLQRYGGLLRDDISHVGILHKDERCYLEITTRHQTNSSLLDEVVERADLSFITTGNFQKLNGYESVFVTARLFVEELTPYDLIHCTSLFTDEAAELIERQYISGVNQHQL